jgi:type IV pilus assembly protein PilC
MNKSTNLVAFQWEGTNRRGEHVKGEMTAPDNDTVKNDLRRQGVFATKIKKKPTALFGGAKKVKQNDITIFSRQVATMLGAGIPLIQSLELIAKGCEKPSLQNLINGLKSTIEGGVPVAEALQQYPDYFNDLYCNLIAAGEKSGTLDLMFNRIAAYKEKFESIKAKVKKALFYPTAVIIVAFVISSGLLIFVVPQFAELFKSFGADLPMPTRIVMAMSNFMKTYWWLVFGAIGGAIFAFKTALKKSANFAHKMDKVKLKFPIIGDILRKSAIARFARTLSTTFSAGLPLMEALQTVAGATGNWLYFNATEKIRDKVSTGQTLKSAMQESGLFPVMVVQMVGIGEESGTLENMLAKVAGIYEEQVDNAVDSLSSLLEPFIMAILGVMVGGLVIAMYLPIFKLGSIVH